MCFCKDCLYWDRNTELLYHRSGKCTQKQNKTVLGEDLTTFDTNYCELGLKNLRLKRNIFDEKYTDYLDIKRGSKHEA